MLKGSVPVGVTTSAASRPPEAIKSCLNPTARRDFLGLDGAAGDLGHQPPGWTSCPL